MCFNLLHELSKVWDINVDLAMLLVLSHSLLLNIYQCLKNQAINFIILILVFFIFALFLKCELNQDLFITAVHLKILMEN
jgi:hypothetical protein